MTKDTKSISAIILASGDSRRMKLECENSKIFMSISGKPCLSYSLNTFRECSFIKEFIVVCKDKDKQKVKSLIEDDKSNCYKIITGGKTRQESVFNGFINSSKYTDYLLIHDAARCLITKELINKVTLSAIKSRSCAILGVPVKDTIKVVETIENENIVKETKNRDSLWQIQTPQVIRKDLYRFCIKKAIKENKVFTDDSQLIENYTDAKVCVVLGEYDNLKLTTREDICIIESLLKKRKQKKI